MSARLPALLAGLFVLYLACGSTGYGNDSDTYAMLRTWSGLARGEGYLPSRAPGYPVPELALGAAAELGGSRAANALPALAACAALAAFYLLLLPRFGSANALWSLAAAGLNPHWMIAASSSMDYVFGAAFFLWGLVAWGKDKPLWAAPAFALAAASRITYAPLALIAFAFRGGALSPRGRALRDGAAALFLLLTVLAYVPSWNALGTGMFQATFADGPAAFLGWGGMSGAGAYAGRFAYKNVYLWGLPAGLIVLAGLLALARSLRGSRDTGVNRKLIWGVSAGLICAELFFLRLPMEIAYLLPVLFAAIFLINGAPGGRYFLMALALAHAVEGVISLQVLQVEYSSRSHARVEAVGAHFRPHWERGALLQDWVGRPESQEYFFKTVLSDHPPGLPPWKP